MSGPFPVGSLVDVRVDDHWHPAEVVFRGPMPGFADVWPDSDCSDGLAYRWVGDGIDLPERWFWHGLIPNVNGSTEVRAHQATTLGAVS